MAVALAQIGEFSFILADDRAASWALLTPAATNALVAAAIVSIILNPLLYRLVDPIERWLRGASGAVALASAAHADSRRRPGGRAASASARHRAVIVGYGPVGRTVVRLLRENGIEPTVIELNMETVRALREDGRRRGLRRRHPAETLKAAGAAARAT